MYFKKQSYTNDMEILYSNANLVAFSGTVKSIGIIADASGKKYVKAGSLIAADGSIVKQTGASGSETLSATPVGVLFQTVDVTNGDMPCSLVVEGYLREDRVLGGFTATKTKVKEALPKITFR
jgi:hypothetical protein